MTFSLRVEKVMDVSVLGGVEYTKGQLRRFLHNLHLASLDEGLLPAAYEAATYPYTLENTLYSPIDPQDTYLL